MPDLENWLYKKPIVILEEDTTLFTHNIQQVTQDFEVEMAKKHIFKTQKLVFLISPVSPVLPVLPTRFTRPGRAKRVKASRDGINPTLLQM